MAATQMQTQDLSTMNNCIAPLIQDVIKLNFPPTSGHTYLWMSRFIDAQQSSPCSLHAASPPCPRGSPVASVSLTALALKVLCTRAGFSSPSVWPLHPECAGRRAKHK